MDLQYLRRLVKIFDDSAATELDIEEEGIRIKISKNAHNLNHDTQTQHIVHMQPFYPQQPMPQVQMPAAQPMQQPVQKAPEATITTAPAETPAITEDTSGMHEIKSPIVGTFYRAPSPDSDPFVQVGTHVTPGTTLCIIEAMKLMNEIESDVSGTIEKILVENGEPVEYNQAIFLVKPD